jgi:ABC-2 type transport system permease protein
MPRVAPPPLCLLLRICLLQAWRRLLSVREQSRLLSALIALFMAGYFGLAFWLFWKGLGFVATFPGLGTLLTERLLFLLFAFLFLLLWFSNLVISYTNLFRNRETTFLLALPVPPQIIFQWKFIESALLASWAFLFLIAPLLTAYGLTVRVPWHFYVVMPAFITLYIVLPAVGGAWCAVNLARYLDRRSFQLLALGAAAVLLVGIALALKPAPVSDEMLETRVLDVLDRLLVRTRYAQHPLLPSYWLSISVLSWAEGAIATAGFFMLVLFSHALFFGFLAFTSMGRMFYEAASAVQSRGSIWGRWGWFGAWRCPLRQFTYTGGFLEVVFGLFRWVRPEIRALLVKDTRMFWRDTTQWGQTLVLFGLLGIYVINLRHFSHQITNPFWINLVSHLNLLACALNLATLTTRFVFPQFSQEGKRFWIVGLAPLGLAQVVKAKFWLASSAALVLTTVLMWLSCHMLKMPWARTLLFMGAISTMTFSLTGLALGLGALYPNFKEDNPSKIVSGFGGTFCLVLSFLYIIGSVVLLAAGSSWTRRGGPAAEWSILSWLGFGLWSLLLGWAPWRLGLRRLHTFEL